MAKAIWQGKVLAESDKTILIEGNAYFPPDSIQGGYLKETDHHTTCPWKGEASYFDIEVDGNVNPNAAWVYKAPKEAAKEIKGYIAFWKGVAVSD
jgi:uncharacterized protein (DUF427 family)